MFEMGATFVLLVFLVLTDNEFMLISREREKLIEAIKYFSKKTKYCGLIKLFKLLYFLDFTHFRQTARSVTGLVYSALPRGPVPEILYREIKTQHVLDGKITIHEYSEIETETGKAYTPAKIEVKGTFNPRFFTKRELRLMEQLAFIFMEAKAEQMSDVSHLKGQPWHVTKTRHGIGSPIDYLLSLDGSDEQQLSKEEVVARMEESEEIRKAFS